MENSQYVQGKDLCEKLFWRTGDIRFYNMAKGFENLENENKKS